MSAYRTQIKPVAARAKFCDADSLSAGRAKSPRPATTRPHFIMGAQKNTVQRYEHHSDIPVFGPAGWFINARKRLPKAADAILFSSKPKSETIRRGNSLHVGFVDGALCMGYKHVYPQFRNDAWASQPCKGSCFVGHVASFGSTDN